MSLGVLTETMVSGRTWAFRRRLEEALARLRAGGWPILQTAVAAWYLATLVLGHERPFFAAIAAVISLGVVVGHEGRRAVELVFGVACGLTVADLLVLAIGTGPAQIVVALAMTTALLLGGTAAAVSGLLAISLEPSTTGLSPDRFFDALVGSGVALTVRTIFPINPRLMVEGAARPIFDELIVMLGETTAASHTADLELAEGALQTARGIDAAVNNLKEALAAGYKTARFSPPRRRDLGYLTHHGAAADQLDLAVRNTRVQVRAAVNLLQGHKQAPEQLFEALLDLARAVETSMLVGQIRSTAIDLLRASGMDRSEARQALNEVAARRASQEESSSAGRHLAVGYNPLRGRRRIGAELTGDLRGRVALVTGASRRRGIGAAICRALAAGGADVFFTYLEAYDREMSREASEPEDLREELRRMGVRAEGAEVDLSLPDSPERLLDAVAGRFGEPSILVNNAAYSARDGFRRLDAATLDAHYAVNLRATALLSVEFARRYPGGPGGRIINLTSGQSLGPMPGELAYAATKGAIEAFTVTLAAEVGGRGITVNAVNPGPTDTGWMTEDLKRDLAARFPAGRVGEPEDVARLVAFLAGEDAAWITGQIVHSEGGFLRA